jgi:hypothetical protein
MCGLSVKGQNLRFFSLSFHEVYVIYCAWFVIFVGNMIAKIRVQRKIKIFMPKSHFKKNG